MVAIKSVPPISRRVTALIEHSLENTLKTHISISKVDLGYFNRIILNDVLIEDRQGKTMLKAARLSGKLELLPLLQGRISIPNIQFYGFEINLYRPQGKQETNFQFLTEILADNDSTTKKHNIQINSILIRRGKVTWNDYNKQPLRNCLDPNHLNIQGLNTTASLKHLTNDSLNLIIKKISFNEQSGTNLKQCNFKLKANKNTAIIEDLKIEIPHSNLNAKQIKLTYNHQDNKHHTLKNITGNLFGTINPKDITPLIYNNKTQTTLNNLSPFNIEIQLNEQQNNTNHSQLTIHTDDNSLNARITAQTIINENEKEKTRTSITIETLDIEQQIIKQITPNLTHNNTITNLTTLLETIQINGTADYQNKTWTTNLNTTTALGTLQTNGTFDNKKHINIQLTTNNFNTDKLLSNKTTTQTENPYTSLDISINGTLQNKPYKSKLQAVGDINNLQYNLHTYGPIHIEAQYDKQTWTTNIQTNDTCFNAAIKASGQIGKQQTIKATAQINQFNPNTLGWTKLYPETTFKGNLFVDLTGHEPDDLNGTLRLTNFTIKDLLQTIDIDSFIVKKFADKTDRKHLINIQSNFMQAQLQGTFKTKDLKQHTLKQLGNYLPILNDTTQLQPRKHNTAKLTINITDTKPLEKLLAMPVKITNGCTLTADLDNQTDKPYITANANTIEWGKHILKNFTIQTDTHNDSLQLNTQFNKITKNGEVQVNINFQAADNQIAGKIDWKDSHTQNYTGNLSAITTFQHDQNGNRLTTININPTKFTVEDSTWNIDKTQIQVNKKYIDINHFNLTQGQRQITLNGRVSALQNDTLTAQLKSIDLEYLFNLINFHTIEFGGEATGNIHATNLYNRNPVIESQLKVHNFTFNYAPFGEMNINIDWGKHTGTLDINAHITDKPNNGTTDVIGQVLLGNNTQKGLELNITTQNVNLSFLNFFTKGIFTHMWGRADGWVHVFGPFRGINLEGDAYVHQGGMKVNATEVDYFLYNDTILMRPGNIIFQNTPIYDHKGKPGTNRHYAIVNGTLKHTYLSKLTYNIDIDAHNILGYNVKDFGDEVFCGTAYATGNIQFNGKPGTLNININATPEENTEFIYNMTSPAAITDNTFITYTDHNHTNNQTTNTNNPAPDKKQYEQETDMHINFQLDIQPKATMKILMDPKSGDYIALNGHGNIKADYYNKGDFTMYGTYTTDHGIYKLSIQDVIRKDFTFNQGGTITFTGTPLQADLNLQAVYTVPSVSLNDLSARNTFSQNNVRVNCIMNLGGKAQTPQITFDFDIPNVSEDEKQMVKSLINTEEEKNMQVIYLLGIGRFYTYDYTNTKQNQSTTAMKSLLSTTLSGQINQMFSTLLGNQTNWNFGTNLSTGEIGWSDMDVEGILSGRLLNNRLLINGNFGYRDNSTTQTSNFIGDFDLQWLLTKNGNISIKAYSKTNDRYFTKSSLSTQGIGIGAKKDFNNWKDFFRLNKTKQQTQQ